MILAEDLILWKSWQKDINKISLTSFRGAFSVSLSNFYQPFLLFREPIVRITKNT